MPYIPQEVLDKQRFCPGKRGELIGSLQTICAV